MKIKYYKNIEDNFYLGNYKDIWCLVDGYDFTVGFCNSFQCADYVKKDTDKYYAWAIPKDIKKIIRNFLLDPLVEIEYERWLYKGWLC